MRLVLLVSLLFCNTAYALSSECGEKITEQGYCESPVKVVWCEQQIRHSLDCKKGSICAWNDTLEAFDCVSIEDDCMSDGKAVLLTGNCLENNSVVQWCDSGKIKKLTCPAGTICGWNDTIEMMDCVKDSCLDVPTTGVCSDSKESVQWCTDGKLVFKECTADEECAYDKNDKRWDCREIQEANPSPPDSDNGSDNVSLVPPGKDDTYEAPSGDTEKHSDGGCSAARANPSLTPGWLILLCLIALRFRRQRVV